MHNYPLFVSSFLEKNNYLHGLGLKGLLPCRISGTMDTDHPWQDRLEYSLNFRILCPMAVSAYQNNMASVVTPVWTQLSRASRCFSRPVDTLRILDLEIS